MYAPQRPSDAWRTFIYATTFISIVVIAALIFFSSIDPVLKVALSIASAWALSNAVTLTKLLRDKQEFEDWQKNNHVEQIRTRPALDA